MDKKPLVAFFAAFYLVWLPVLGFLIPDAGAAASPHETEDLTPLYRILKVRKFLKKYNSPLLDSSRTFVEVSERYNLDWKFLVAISGIESTFGKYIPHNSNNPFGFGNGQSKFASFDEGIRIVGRYLFDMKSKGLDTAEKLGPVYTPPNFRNWITAVNYFMRELENVKL